MPPVSGQVIVTGASGFIGRRLQSKLEEAHIPFSPFPESIDLVREIPALPQETGFTVVHLAGLTAQTGLEPRDVFSGNLRITANLIKALAGSGAGRVVYANTNGYGHTENLPVGEEQPLDLISPYHLSKYLGEQMLLDFGATRGIEMISLRFFNVYGPGQQEPFLLPYVVNRVLAGEPIFLKQPDSRRDYLYVDDAAEAIIKALKTPEGTTGVFNIAGGVSFSSREIARTVMRLAGREVPVQTPEAPEPGAIADSRADIGKAEDILGWAPRIPLEGGIRTMLG